MTPPSLTPEELEQEQLRKYRSSFYTVGKLDFSRHAADDYFGKFARLRLDAVRQHYQGGTILDLCCGSGDYLMPIAEFAESMIGVDFSPELIASAQEKIDTASYNHVTLYVANAKAMPLTGGSVDLLFSFASLYHIPQAEAVIKECARVLKPGGRAILEFGVSHSLNTVVCLAHPEAAIPCHESLSDIQRMVRESGLRIVSNKGYQILPLWGKKPKWLRPLLHPLWKKTMAAEVGGKMLDEYLSNLWPLSHFAFRRIVICEK